MQWYWVGSNHRLPPYQGGALPLSYATQVSFAKELLSLGESGENRTRNVRIKSPLFCH